MVRHVEDQAKSELIKIHQLNNEIVVHFSLFDPLEPVHMSINVIHRCLQFKLKQRHLTAGLNNIYRY